MKPWLLIVAALTGAAVVLMTVWLPAIMVTRVPELGELSPGTVQRSRDNPSNDLLDELHEIAVSFPRYDGDRSEDVLEAADELLAGTYSPDEGLRIGVPFEPGAYVFGGSRWHLDLHSFAIPSLLARAYESCGSNRYLEQATRYVVDWADYESSLPLPFGFTFNDHAIAARSIVVTEVWRLYRNSEIFDPRIAREYLQYVRKLVQLLIEERLYEYRSNHGIMQAMSLLHLGIAFPDLPEAGTAVDVGTDRLKAQLNYYVNAEGVILEHSAGYQISGLMRLSAIWRYFGLIGVKVPGEMQERYRKALDFSAALLRPDLTLPLIGDTGHQEHSPYFIAQFDDDGSVSRPLRRIRPMDLVPDEPVAIRPAAGFAILWNELEAWPDGRGLTQTVLHWGNFPSQVHKHADDASISIWSDGVEWIRGLGSWPYIPTRQTAIGWRSSNAPHWQGEPADTARSTVLEASTVAESVAFFDLVRGNDDGRTIRRQLVKSDARTWIVIDSYPPTSPQGIETVWRFSPGLELGDLGGGAYRISSGERILDIRLDHASVEADGSGNAPWNSGVIQEGEITTAPALRVLSDPRAEYTVAVFRLSAVAESQPLQSPAMHWVSPDDWTLQIGLAENASLGIRRTAETVWISTADRAELSLPLSEGMSASALAAQSDALEAYRGAKVRFGQPFQLALQRRMKVSIAVLLVALAQIGVSLFIRARYPAWAPPLLTTSIFAWIGLALYVGLFFLP